MPGIVWFLSVAYKFFPPTPLKLSAIQKPIENDIWILMRVISVLSASHVYKFARIENYVGIEHINLFWF